MRAAALLPVVCGRTHVDDRAEEIATRWRSADGYRTGGGCGGALSLLTAYRCLECGRWMHADCLRQHFAESGDDQKAGARGQARGDGEG